MKRIMKNIFCRHKNKIIIAEDVAYKRFKLYLCPDCGKTCCHYNGEPPNKFKWKWNYNENKSMYAWKLTKDGKDWINKYSNIFEKPILFM